MLGEEMQEETGFRDGGDDEGKVVDGDAPAGHLWISSVRALFFLSWFRGQSGISIHD